MPRTFIPFRKDEMKGTVIHLDRGSKLRGIGLKEQRLGRDAGAVSGVIKVELDWQTQFAVCTARQTLCS